ncbi:serine-protein kinase ATM [Histomonas meleagridis]|uniref:serine-protein kinase ATM n=1 Tax=Histomonas meleagridis TaxID=135588 RepID=UPI00355A991A|nr:serine-protein kinase ATM [Histomonas meleagridis]KAH0799492.1 serine-protein kinase ATM [Histomonas meleagridis]
MLLKVKGYDGHIYRQILKGNKDDLRQDSVMQQLFVLSSKLLSKQDPNLYIRSYKVIPISPVCGIIQFVEGSLSIQDYLAEEFKNNDRLFIRGALIRYNIGEMKYVDAYKTFRKASKSFHETKKENEKVKLLKTFRQIREKLKPVFRFFFIEHFKNQADWFLSRIRYCRHTATNSMVGHVLGIGDRHLNNILIDVKTGEVIHIDLGIAFEQGKALPVPELIPFRLTGEIIDGMGWKGVDGVFRKSCEKTMKVLRQNVGYFLTVLEVFINDPLYSWKMPNKPKNSSHTFNDTGESSNTKAAESVILQCRRKLEGHETGEELSVEGQVAKLITDATNDMNLCTLYYGWKPFL